MFMPDLVNANVGSEIKWPHDSNRPHNVVGTYKKIAVGSQPQPQPQPQWNGTIDSGFYTTRRIMERCFQ